MKTPNQLSREVMDEFKAAYKAEFDEVLTDEEVQEIALNLLRFFGVIGRTEDAKQQGEKPVN